MIRFFIGFFLVFGAVGGLDNDQNLWQCLALAIVGLGLMFWALPKISQQ